MSREYFDTEIDEDDDGFCPVCGVNVAYFSHDEDCTLQEVQDDEL